MNELRNTLGDRLRIFREHIQLTQAQLAQELQMSKTGLQQNEADKALPGAKFLIALHGRGLNVNWLLSGEGEMLLSDKPTTSSSDDLQLYVESMEVINFLIEKAGKTATYKQRRALVDALYQASKPAGKVDETTAALILKVAA